MLNLKNTMAIARGAFSFNIARSCNGCHGNSPSASVRVTTYQLHQKEIHVGENDEKLVTLSEGDFEEKFIRGSGPGGQKINKTNNCVELRHKETGIVVKHITSWRKSVQIEKPMVQISKAFHQLGEAGKTMIYCHESRSLERNRQIARMRLLDKLKVMFTPSQSSIVKKQEEKTKRENNKIRRRKMKEEAINNKVDL